MRGRVNAVDMLFIGTSNELGGFESGATAKIFGTVPAVVIGRNRRNRGHCRCAALFPQLRKLDELPSAESVREVAAPAEIGARTGTEDAAVFLARLSAKS